MQISVRELKIRLSEYLRRARAGEEIVVASRGIPVARLVRAQPASTDLDTGALERLRAQPWIRPGNGKKVCGPDRPSPVPPGTSDEIIRWGRGE